MKYYAEIDPYDQIEIYSKEVDITVLGMNLFCTAAVSFVLGLFSLLIINPDGSSRVMVMGIITSSVIFFLATLFLVFVVKIPMYSRELNYSRLDSEKILKIAASDTLKREGGSRRYISKKAMEEILKIIQTRSDEDKKILLARYNEVFTNAAAGKSRTKIL